MEFILFIYNTFQDKRLSPVGTAPFVLQGLTFSLYGALIKRWQVGPVLGNAVVSPVSCVPALIAHAAMPTGFANPTIAEYLHGRFDRRYRSAELLSRSASPNSRNGCPVASMRSRLDNEDDEHHPHCQRPDGLRPRHLRRPAP